MGVVASARAAGEEAHFRLRTRLAPRLRVGHSVAVDGVCLTVTRATKTTIDVTAVAETLALTTLGRLRAGARVNLEAALRAGEPIGGHMVQGHVEAVGRVRAVESRGESAEMTIDAPPDLLRYVVHKGSIAVDGVSLTVASLEGAGFRVALIPHTLAATTLGERRPGDAVNLETDLIAKYVERLLGDRAAPAAEGSGVTMDLLREHGFA